jgi:tryptophan synthase alpha chain
MNENTDSKDSPISRVFKELKEKGHKAFIPFITCGYPDMDGFMRTYEVLDSCGADIIEIGIPFSDPLADGPVIQKTSKIAIDNGVTTDSVFEAVGKIREKSSTPIALLTYFNMIYKYGVGQFLNNAADSGANGVIIPDLPLEEYENYDGYFKDSSVDNIMIASLTSDNERLKSIGKAGMGFVYCVSLKGVTGVRDRLSDELEDFLKRLRSVTNLPLAVGFGISTPEQVKSIKDKCDGIIIGSRILNILLKEDDFDKGLKKLEKFVNQIKKSLET